MQAIASRASLEERRKERRTEVVMQHEDLATLSALIFHASPVP